MLLSSRISTSRKCEMIMLTCVNVDEKPRARGVVRRNKPELETTPSERGRLRTSPLHRRRRSWHRRTASVPNIFERPERSMRQQLLRSSKSLQNAWGFPVDVSKCGYGFAPQAIDTGRRFLSPHRDVADWPQNSRSSCNQELSFTRQREGAWRNAYAFLRISAKTPDFYDADCYRLGGADIRGP